MAEGPASQSRDTRLRELFALALDAPRGAVDTLLAAHAADDPTLIAEVKDLLAADAQASGFLSDAATFLPTGEDGLSDSTEVVPAAVAAGTRIGTYEVLSVLGAGGMGQVYLARDTRLDRLVALKLLPTHQHHQTERVRRFEQEARAASGLNHPTIVTIYEIVEAETGHCIAMELVEGQTLREVIGQRPAIGVVARIGRQVAEALRVAHAAGIIHRDIKPENVMLRADGYVKVLDFGLARLFPPGFAASAEAPAPRIARRVFGTLRYMSPEQGRGEDATAATDIFSLGLVLYELATNQHPFAGDSPMEILDATRSLVAAPPSRLNPDVPAALDDLLEEMLQKDPRLRPSAEIVERTLAGLAVARPQADGARLPAPKSRRNLVGREQERAQLRAAYERVKAGHGSIISVSGEPGAGKTTIVEDFLSNLGTDDEPCRVARGRCSERLAGTEVYLPWLEAIDCLLKDPAGESTAQVINTYAPTWYLQVAPASPEDASAARVRTELASASPERLTRELAGLLHEVSRQQPLVCFFDDLHWADISTVDLLSFVADRVGDQRILIVTTHRPSDLLLGKHPFAQVRQGWLARGLCGDLPLRMLTADDVDRYLAIEFPEHRFPRELSVRIHARTDGSPLFMTDLVRYLRDRHIIARDHGRWVLAQPLEVLDHDLPESVRSMIEFKIAQLDAADRRLLAAASVQGAEFDSAIVAEGLSLDAADVEERLDGLDRVHGLVKLVEERQFPDRTLTSRYRFTHVLYQNALYAAIKPSRKVQLAAALAHSLESHWGDRRTDVATDLAMLFETAREFGPAADYFRAAAVSASELFASREAEALARRGLAAIGMLPAGVDRLARELSTQLVLGNALIATLGYAAPDVENAFSRAGGLCRQLGDTPSLLPVHCGFCAFHLVKGQARTALAIGQEFLGIAERCENPATIVGHRLIGVASFYLGDPFAARQHLERASLGYDPVQHRSLTTMYGGEPEMDAQSYLGLTLWVLGYPDQALAAHQKALQLARDVSHAHSRAHTLSFAATQYQLRHDWRRVNEIVQEQLALTVGQGLLLWRIYGNAMRGWVLAGQGDIAEGIDEMETNLAGLSAFGAQLFQPYIHALLAEAHLDNGQPEAGLRVLDRATRMVEKTEECWWDAELFRLRGDLLASLGPASLAEAERHLVKALDTARRTQARSLELRAAMSLSRLWQRQGRRPEARVLLADACGWFTEGFATADLKKANALLQQL